MPVPSNRNSVGPSIMALYVLGIACLFIGIYVSTITQINLLTGATSNPYIGVGIPLAVAGLAVVVMTQRVAKRKLQQ